MSDKQAVIEALREMPEGATLEQISKEIAILAAIHEGEAELDAGKGVPVEEVRGMLAGWIKKPVVVPADEWRAIQETLHLLSIPGMRESIHAGMAEPLESLGLSGSHRRTDGQDHSDVDALRMNPRYTPR